MEWKEWKGKKVFLLLNSDHAYTGIIIDSDDNFISFIDKFNDKITINTSEIKIIKEEKK